MTYEVIESRTWRLECIFENHIMELHTVYIPLMRCGPPHVPYYPDRPVLELSKCLEYFEHFIPVPITLLLFPKVPNNQTRVNQIFRLI
jgi:hypothetical protein